MPHQITYEPVNRIHGVNPKTTTKETVADAWMLVQQLQASDERVTIDPDGVTIDWTELRERSKAEAN